MNKIPGAQNGHTVVTVFDRAYSPETQAEGQAVSWAVATGACNECGYLATCSRSDGVVWRPPATAACMIRKQELLHTLPRGRGKS